MALGDPDDVLRSLRRYVSLMLGSPPWRARIQRTRVADDDRPTVIIEEAAPLQTNFARAGTVNQGDMQKVQSYAVVAYPVLASDPANARLQAGELRSLLDAGFSRGLVSDDVPPKNIGAPFAFPIWDFEGVAVTGTNREGPADPYEHAMIDRTFNVRAIQDPLDEIRFTVVVNLRASWWVPGRVPPPAPSVGVLTGGWHPHP